MALFLKGVNDHLKAVRVPQVFLDQRPSFLLFRKLFSHINLCLLRTIHLVRDTQHPRHHLMLLNHLEELGRHRNRFIGQCTSDQKFRQGLLKGVLFKTVVKLADCFECRNLAELCHQDEEGFARLVVEVLRCLLGLPQDPNQILNLSLRQRHPKELLELSLHLACDAGIVLKVDELSESFHIHRSVFVPQLVEHALN